MSIRGHLGFHDHQIVAKVDPDDAYVGQMTYKGNTVSYIHDKMTGYGNSCLRMHAKIERLEKALHRISLASANSMSTKDECGRIAREALNDKE